ncbi:hypothetical protein LCGC14_0409880 [marine sediment metagenome]|uniref:Uncharacterized protein n=1 Tax=marine sediment metagenome TaxID=412755 RepID=A0A0F9SZR9_9ZZZZ
MEEKDKDITVPPAFLIPFRDPNQWDCPPLSGMPEYQRRDHKRSRIEMPHLTDEALSGWNRMVREQFYRDEEWAIRFAIEHLIVSYISANPSRPFDRFKRESQMDAIHRRNLKREEYESMFRTWGDVINNIEDVGDIDSASNILKGVTEYLDELPTQAEKRVLVSAAHVSAFWSLIRLLAGSPNYNDPASPYPPHAIMAQKWMDAWESLRKGRDIGT